MVELMSRNKVFRFHIIIPMRNYKPKSVDRAKEIIYQYMHDYRIDAHINYCRGSDVVDEIGLIEGEFLTSDPLISKLSEIEDRLISNGFTAPRILQIYGKVNIFKWIKFRMGRYLDCKKERLERSHIERIKDGSTLDTQAALEARIKEGKELKTESGLTISEVKKQMNNVTKLNAEEKKAEEEKKEKEKLEAEQLEKERDESTKLELQKAEDEKRALDEAAEKKRLEDADTKTEEQKAIDEKRTLRKKEKAERKAKKRQAKMDRRKVEEEKRNTSNDEDKKDSGDNGSDKGKDGSSST